MHTACAPVLVLLRVHCVGVHRLPDAPRRQQQQHDLMRDARQRRALSGAGALDAEGRRVHDGAAARPAVVHVRPLQDVHGDGARPPQRQRRPLADRLHLGAAARHADRSLGPVPVPVPVSVPGPRPRPRPNPRPGPAPRPGPRPRPRPDPLARDMDTAATLRGRGAEAVRGAAQLAGQPARLEARPERQHAADALERLAQHGAAHIGGGAC
eukprot:scaffold3098_cov61-Phaeocystis_antarctica.AAC.3